MNQDLERFLDETREVLEWLRQRPIQLSSHSGCASCFLSDFDSLMESCESVAETHSWSHVSIGAGSIAYLRDADAKFGLRQVLMFDAICRSCRTESISGDSLVDMLCDVFNHDPSAVH